MSKIEDLVIFKNEKELSETEKSIEKIFGISFQSYVRRLEIGLDAEGLSHDDDSAVAHILADMGKKDSILWIFSLCCEDSREAAKILYANTTLLLQVSRIMNRGIKIRTSFLALFPQRCLRMMQGGCLMRR